MRRRSRPLAKASSLSSTTWPTPSARWTWRRQRPHPRRLPSSRACSSETARRPALPPPPTASRRTGTCHTPHLRRKGRTEPRRPARPLCSLASTSRAPRRRVTSSPHPLQAHSACSSRNWGASAASPPPRLRRHQCRNPQWCERSPHAMLTSGGDRGPLTRACGAGPADWIPGGHAAGSVSRPRCVSIHAGGGALGHGNGDGHGAGGHAAGARGAPVALSSWTQLTTCNAPQMAMMQQMRMQPMMPPQLMGMGMGMVRRPVGP